MNDAKKSIIFITEGLSFKHPNGILTWLNSILYNLSNEFFNFGILNITTDIRDYPYKPPKSLSYLINVDPWNLKERHYRFSNENEISFTKVKQDSTQNIKKTMKHLSKRVRKNSLVSEQIIIPAYEIIDSFEIPRGDIFHAANPGLAGLVGALLTSTKNGKLIISEHGDIMTEWKLRLINPYFLGEIRYPKELKNRKDHVEKSQRELEEVLKYTLNKSDLILPVAQFHLRRNKVLGVPNSKVKVLRNGVPLTSFAKKEENNEGKKIRVGVVARINPIKGFENLAIAAKDLIDRNSCWEFHMYGPVDDYDYFNYFRGILEELRIDNFFIFHDSVWDPRKLYDNIDVFTLPSLMEGLPYSLIEATASGITPVATNVGGVSEIIMNVGYLVKPMDPKDLAKKLLYAHNEFRNTRKLAQYKKLRKERIKRYFSDKLFTRKLYEMYVQTR